MRLFYPRHSPNRMPLSIDERVQLILLSGNGRTHREIADAFSRLHPERKPISHATVGNLLTKFRETGSVHDRGKPLSTSGSGSPSNDLTFEQSANERETSMSSTCGATQNQKRYRYAVVDIKNRSSDDLYDLLINNGFSDFLLLNELRDHPDIELVPSKREESKPVLNLECESDMSRAPSSNDGEAEVPYFEEVSAADLLGGTSGIERNDADATVEVYRDRKPSPLFENHPRDGFQSTFASSQIVEQNERSGHVIQQLDSSGEGTDSETCDGDRGRGRPEHPAPYVTCQLCKKGIVSTRFSNLTNHARRHSIIKKFKCIYCDIQHNEHAKIRNHMANMHGDTTAEPIDHSWRMKKVWEFLLQKCFPNCTPNNLANQPSIVENDSASPSNTGPVTFLCALCGFCGDDQWWRVRWHISSQHPGMRYETNIKAIYADAMPPMPEPDIEHTGAVKNSAIIAMLSNQKQKPIETPSGSQEDTSFEVYVSKKDEDQSGLRSLLCRLCNRIIDGKGLVSVVVHAKAHYHIKQFECNRCGFGSNTRSLVRRHIYTHHRRGCSVLIEHNDENMRKAWTQVVRTCFPNLSNLLEKEENKGESKGVEVDLTL